VIPTRGCPATVEATASSARQKGLNTLCRRLPLDVDDTQRFGYCLCLALVKPLDRPGQAIRFLTVSPQKQPDLQVILASWFADHTGKNATSVAAIVVARKNQLEGERKSDFCRMGDHSNWRGTPVGEGNWCLPNLLCLR